MFDYNYEIDYINTVVLRYQFKKNNFKNKCCGSSLDKSTDYTHWLCPITEHMSPPPPSTTPPCLAPNPKDVYCV